MKFKASDGLLALSMSIMSSGLIAGGVLIHESVTGKLQSADGSRASLLFLSALVLPHIAVVPLQLASVAIDREQELEA
jgi:hypothetical protein